MSQSAVNEIVTRSTTDDRFAAQFLTDADRALSSYDLTSEERNILKSMDQERILRAAGRSGDASSVIIHACDRVA
jgi:hypothetical protein